MAVLCAPLAGRVVGGRGPRIPLLVSGAGFVLSGLVFTQLADDTPLPVLIAGCALFGLGFGMLNAPVTATAVAGLPADQAGVAAAVASTCRQVGASLGAAVLPTVVTTQLQGPMSTGFSHASHLAWWITVGCGALVGAVGLLTTGRLGQRTAVAAAAELCCSERVFPPRVPGLWTGLRGQRRPIRCEA
ncbi:MFS transporter [Saccharopolyspora sp. NPDC000359]|uniref:MFS transporter n=1 Tax=Saccharopolyspora sp. NPDC000359 TaxID=3154251 RepID=UPI003325922E